MKNNARSSRISEILSVLNSNEVRATYGAVGNLVGIPAIAVSSYLGDRRPEASWIVSASTGKPTGYLKNEIHPELFSKTQILKTGKDLRTLLDTNYSTNVNTRTDLPDQPEIVDTPNESISTSLEKHQNGSFSEIRTSVLMGIDLAWMAEKNGSGIAVGLLNERTLSVKSIFSNIKGNNKVIEIVDSESSLCGIAIDAPLIIKNRLSSRPCEKSLSAKYGRKFAGAFPSNLSRFPDASSVRLSQQLESQGYSHLGDPGKTAWQVECYPHPALIEIFDLEQRLPYKKGTVQDKRDGQIRLAGLIRGLAKRNGLKLVIDERWNHYFDSANIHSLTGQALKNNEDALDAVICLYIAGLYAVEDNIQCFGDTKNGYIVVPG